MQFVTRKLFNAESSYQVSTHSPTKKPAKPYEMASLHLNDLPDEIDFVIKNGRSNSCDAIQEVDEDDVDLELADLAEEGASGDDPAKAEERKAAALRIIRRAKRAGLVRDRAYSTSEGSNFPAAPSAGLKVAKNSRKSRTGFGRGLPKKGTFSSILRRNRKRYLKRHLFWSTVAIAI